MQGQDVSAVLDFPTSSEALYIWEKTCITWLDRLKTDIKRINKSTKSKVLFTSVLSFCTAKFACLVDAVCCNPSIKEFDMQVCRELCPLFFNVYQRAECLKLLRCLTWKASDLFAFQGTAITADMMPSILKLIELLHPERLLYIGLSDTQLTSEMFAQIIPALASKPVCRLPGCEEKVRLVLEMQSKRAPYEWLKKDVYDEVICGAQGRGIKVTMTLPKPTSRTEAARNTRYERRANRWWGDYNKIPLLASSGSHSRFWHGFCCINVPNVSFGPKSIRVLEEEKIVLKNKNKILESKHLKRKTNERDYRKGN